MEKTDTQVRPRKPAGIAGLVVVVAAGFVILTGCAGTFNDAVSMGQQVHSMTPCGMMMDSMMGHGTGSQPAHEAGVGTDSTAGNQTAPPEVQSSHAGH